MLGPTLAPLVALAPAGRRFDADVSDSEKGTHQRSTCTAKLVNLLTGTGACAAGEVLARSVGAPPQGLGPVEPDAPIYSAMPPLHVAWVPSSQPDLYPAERSALLPLYLDLERESQLAELRLPCSNTEMHWLQAGAALFLNGTA